MSSGLVAEGYDVTALPFIPFSDTGGEALSNNGVVAGGIANSDGSVSLAEWSKGVLTHLGLPPGLPNHDFNKPRVFGINNAGTIVGTIHTSAGELPSRWFIYDRHRFTVLPLADPTDLGGAAIGINNRGQVVGYDRTSSNNLTGWLWSDGAYFRLPVPGTNTAALGINSSGTIVGNRSLSFMRRVLTGQLGRTGERGYVLSHGTPQYLAGFVYAINDLGEAAGGSTSNGKAMATVFKNGIATVILSLPSYAVGINSSAVVVGYYQPAGLNRRHLLIWSANSGAFDLTPDGYRSAEAAAVNDRGDVLGFGETVSGKTQYFLLAPDPDGVLTPKAVPSTRPLALGGRSSLARR
jgi:probable HAF family extracellular repeat protein